MKYYTDFISKLITFIQYGEEESTWGYIYAVLLFLTVTAQSVIIQQYYQRAFVTGLKVRSAILSTVYRKVRLNHVLFLWVYGKYKSRKIFLRDEIINITLLMTNLHFLCDLKNGPNVKKN